MNSIQKRFLAFLLLCIPIRLVLVFLSKTINTKYLPYLGYFAIFIAFGFAYQYLSGRRKSGPETFGAKIWWNHLRPLHSSLYFIFAYLAITKNKYSYVPLLVDVVVGFISFIYYHSQANSLKKLF